MPIAAGFQLRTCKILLEQTFFGLVKYAGPLLEAYGSNKDVSRTTRSHVTAAIYDSQPRRNLQIT